MEVFWFILAIGLFALIFKSHVIVDTGLLEAGLRSEFFERFRVTETQYQNLATQIASTKDSETYAFLGSTPKMREWGTGRLAKGLRTERYSVENMKYEATLEVDRDEISDDQTGQIRIRVNELAQHAATHKDYLISQLLINGATAGYHSYDGVPFFGATHESGSSGAQDNDLAATAAAAKKTTAEFKTALDAAISTMLAFLDDQGEPMVLSQSGLICVVPPSMVFAAREAVEATIISNTSNVMQGVAGVISFPWLTLGTTWYLLKTDGIVRPLIFQDREPIEFSSIAEGSEEEFRREKYLFGVRARYRLTYGYWQYAVRTVFNN